MATPTSAKEWKKKSKGVELELPSGNVCLARRPGMDAIMSAGIIPDTLTPIAAEAVEKAQRNGKPNEKAEEKELLNRLLGDRQALNDVFDATDRATAMCVVEPKVLWHKNMDGSVIPSDERDEETLYTDEIDQNDKIFIFNFVVGGTRDLESFRQEYGNAVADLQPSESVARPAKRPARAKR